jgi:hypothetical protein
MAKELGDGRNRMVDETDAIYGELRTVVGGGCLTKLKELNIEILNQEEENMKLSKDCSDMKKECSQLQQLMIMVGKRLGNLEAAVGSYGPKSGKKK